MGGPFGFRPTHYASEIAGGLRTGEPVSAALRHRRQLRRPVRAHNRTQAQFQGDTQQGLRLLIIILLFIVYYISIVIFIILII